MSESRDICEFFNITARHESERKMRHYLNTADDVLREAGSTADGLSEREARERLERFGKNRLKEGKKKSAFVRFFEQLKDPMLIILIVAAAVSGVTVSLRGYSVPQA